MYYRARWSATVSLHLQLSPYFQYIQHPGFNQDRRPVRFYAPRLHLEDWTRRAGRFTSA